MNSQSRAIQCFVTPEVHRALKTLAAQQDTTISAMVRTSVVQTIRSVEKPVAETKSKEPPK